MAGLLYHFPNRTIGNWQAAVEQVPELADVMDDCSLSNAPDFPGPAGQGTLAAVGNTVKLRYVKDEQTWIDCGTYWLGWEKDKPPGPNDLEREGAEGHPVKLRDGNVWLVPSIEMLPGGYIQNPEGEIVRRTQTAFQSIENFVEDLWNTKQFSRSEGFRVCGRLLRIGYRIPLAVCLMTGLNLIGDNEMDHMLAALFDIPTVEAQSQKKTE